MLIIYINLEHLLYLLWKCILFKEKYKKYNSTFITKYVFAYSHNKGWKAKQCNAEWVSFVVTSWVFQIFLYKNFKYKKIEILNYVPVSLGVTKANSLPY